MQTLPPLRGTSPKPSVQGRQEKCNTLAINYGKRLHLLRLFRLNLRVQRFCGKVSGARYFVATARREGEGVRYADSRGAASAHART